MRTSFTIGSANPSMGLKIKCGTMKRSARLAQSLHHASPIVTNVSKFTFVRLRGSHFGAVADTHSLRIANKSRSQVVKPSIHTVRFDIGKLVAVHTRRALVRAALGLSVRPDISRYTLLYGA